MYKTLSKVNQVTQKLSTKNVIPSEDNYSLYANYKLAMKVKELKVCELDLIDYEYNKDDFIKVLVNNCDPQERDIIIDNLKAWEKDINFSLTYINNTWQIFLNYYHLKPNLIEYDKYDKDNYAPDYEYIELENAKNLLRELNKEIAKIFVISE